MGLKILKDEKIPAVRRGICLTKCKTLFEKKLKFYFTLHMKF